ncbi:MAG TPA: rod shape-determining protein RodA [Nitrospirae bacterium]|nr:rod shape-determining protein RodA [Nitrospirota bacterium]
MDKKGLRALFEVKHIDWLAFTAPVLLSVLGILTIYSATRPVLDSIHPSYYIRQSIWLVIGLTAMILTSMFDYRRLLRYSYPVYVIGLLLLLVTILFGHKGMGAQRWLRIGPVSFQPSEVFKIILIIALSKYLSTVRTPLTYWQSIFSFVIFGMVPFVILFSQPDLGTAIMLLLIMLVMLLCKGLERRLVLSSLIVLLLLLPLTGKTIWNGLKDYQKNRLVAFIDPGVDPKGIGYQIEQSKVTIGSGKTLGKGYLKGTQGPLRFLPEKHTDFIFAVFAEEWGFVGSLLLLSVYMVLIIRGLETAYYSKDVFGTLLAIGISVMFLLYVSINIGMTMGLMPVVGVPLPFFSYGGTALLSNFIAVGLLISIRKHRFTLFY